MKTLFRVRSSHSDLKNLIFFPHFPPHPSSFLWEADTCRLVRIRCTSECVSLCLQVPCRKLKWSENGTQVRVMQLSCKTFIYHPVAQHSGRKGEVIHPGDWGGRSRYCWWGVMLRSTSCWICLGSSEDGITKCSYTSLEASPDLIVVWVALCRAGPSCALCMPLPDVGHRTTSTPPVAQRNAHCHKLAMGAEPFLFPKGITQPRGQNTRVLTDRCRGRGQGGPIGKKNVSELPVDWAKRRLWTWRAGTFLSCFVLATPESACLLCHCLARTGDPASLIPWYSPHWGGKGGISFPPAYHCYD